MIETEEKTVIPLGFVLRSRFFSVFLLLCVTFLAYHNSFRGSWHFDDEKAILENPRIKHAENIPKLLTRYYLSRGVLQATFALNYCLGGTDVFGYHLFNLILHMSVVVLLYLTLCELTSMSTYSSFLRRYLPLASALIFAVHPVNTETVTYIVSRSSLLTTFFYILGFFLFIKAVRPGRKPHTKMALLAGCGLAFLLGAGTKEIIITLPAMCVVYLYYFVAEDRNPLKFVMRYKWQFSGLASLAGAYLIYRHFHGGIIASIPDAAVRSFYVNFLTEMNVIVRYYLVRLFVPVGLNIDPDFPISNSILEPWTFFSAIVLACMVYIAVGTFGKERVLSFGLVWFLVAISPTSSFIPLLDVAAEHRLYLPGLGFSIVLAYLILKVTTWKAADLRARAKLTFGALGAVVLALCIGTIRRNEVYESPLALWTDTVKKSPNKARPHNNLADSYEKLGRLDEALEEYRLIIEKIDPHYMRAYYGMGNVYLKRGQLKEAVRYYHKALKMKPGFAPAYNNLGIAYDDLGMYDEAIAAYKRALEIDPNFVRAYNNLAIVYAKKGIYGEALSAIRRALELDPGYTVGYVNLGKLHMMMGKYGQAERALRRALELKPDFAYAYGLLGNVYLGMREKERAISCFRKALELDPDGPQAKYISSMLERLEGM